MQWGPLLPKKEGMIQVDIGRHPPIPFGLPFGPTPSILVAFHIQNNLLFLAGFRVLHSQSRVGGLMIQVDIGGHPHIPFEPPPSVHSFFQFQHNLLFLAVFRVMNFWSRFEALMIQVDIGGHPPISFEPPPSFLSVFQFWHNLLFLAFFWVLNLWSCLEALNEVFWDTRSNMGL